MCLYFKRILIKKSHSKSIFLKIVRFDGYSKKTRKLVPLNDEKKKMLFKLDETIIHILQNRHHFAFF